MFDQSRLMDVLVAYKQNFVSKQWGEEKYKWEAVRWFQDNWDVNATDFAEMLSRSLDKTFNLLASNNNFPKGMIVGFAKAAPEEVRAKPHTVSGMLLYAATDEAIQPNNSYQMSGNKISVKTLDLNRDFSEIAAQLNAIVEDHFGKNYANAK